ncbi:hypothetical protein [Yinghuangia sp. YIM S10712]|uniref:hypothetical protein n=1 Tax=Yinghuangia sp. YIM S10712 TaxID=3436930 RepID=UPI003F53497F
MTTNRELAAARATLTGYGRIPEAIGELRAYLVNLGRDKEPIKRDGVDRIVNAVLNGQPIPDDYIEQEDEAERRTVRGKRIVHTVNSAISRLQHKEKTFLADNADPVLEHLAGRLADTLDQARHVDEQLGDIRTMQQAMASNNDDHTRAYRELCRLTDVYGLIRDAQYQTIAEVVRDQPVGARHYFEGAVAEIANPWDIETITFDLYGTMRLAYPWPDDGDPRKRLYGADYLRWAATTTTARIWLPTMPELQEARECARDMHQALKKVSDIYGGRIGQATKAGVSLDEAIATARATVLERHDAA